MDVEFEVKLFVVLVIVVLVIGLPVMSMLGRTECESKWEGSGMATQFSLMGGCRVRMPDGRWLPENAVREVVGP